MVKLICGLLNKYPLVNFSKVAYRVPRLADSLKEGEFAMNKRELS